MKKGSHRRNKSTFDDDIIEPNDTWISVDALLLLACVHCEGFDSECAAVFHRIVAPEYDDIITITDKDLTTALRFMIITATILEEMTREMIAHPEVKPNYKAYERKIRKYEPTIDGIIQDFQDTVFGEFLNRRSRDTFIEMLA